jgi:hypothetical protein
MTSQRPTYSMHVGAGIGERSSAAKADVRRCLRFMGSRRKSPDPLQPDFDEGVFIMMQVAPPAVRFDTPRDRRGRMSRSWGSAGWIGKGRCDARLRAFPKANVMAPNPNGSLPGGLRSHPKSGNKVQAKDSNEKCEPDRIRAIHKEALHRGEINAE